MNLKYNLKGKFVVNIGPKLAACTNFNQGYITDRMLKINSLTQPNIRDGMYWNEVEKAVGVYTYTGLKSNFLDNLNGFASLTINNGNALHDDVNGVGVTPYTPAGCAAFGAFAAALALRFPELLEIEVMNEYNGDNFVSGPVKDSAGYSQTRADYYLAIIEEVATQARAARSSIRILGGATHSIPTSVLKKMLDGGLANYIDALVLHPYTSKPETARKEIAVLRRQTAAATMPIQITEFGTTDIPDAPNHFAKWYAMSALSGVERMGWFASHDRGDGYATLFSSTGTLTPVGEAYEWAVNNLQGLEAISKSAGLGAYAVQFGKKICCIWGEPRALILRNGAYAVNARGQTVASPSISQSPIYVITPTNITYGGSGYVDFGGSMLVADSFHQWELPIGSELQVVGDGFKRFARRSDGEILPLILVDGQSGAGTPWVPYRAPLGSSSRMQDRSLVAVGSMEMCHSWTTTTKVTRIVKASITAGHLSIRRNSVSIYEANGPVSYNSSLLIQANDVIEFAITGGATNYSISISKP